MSPKLRFQILLEPHQLEQLRTIQERTGAPVSEQVRRAIDRWIQEQDGNASRGGKRKR